MSLITFTALMLAAPAAHDLPAGPGPLDNPFKGFAAYSEPGNQHYGPVSMAFVETSWRILEPTEGQYEFDKWERTQWNTPLAKGKPIVFRVFMDYPNQPIGVPQWLIDQGVKMTPYTEFGGGKSPDYENPELQKNMVKLIRALGKRYDRDPRVAFVQVGLLGHWGEWHTYPNDKLFASDKTQRLVLDELHRAFPHKHLMARNPQYESARLPWIGYHDDMIPEDTLGPDQWDFLPTMRRAQQQENWRVAPTGGEMVPRAAVRYMGKDWDTLMRSVEEAHFTWIGPYCPALVQPPNDEYKARMNALIRKLGYEFRLTKATIPTQVGRGQKLSAQIDGVNQGVAPFYYPWPVRLALLGADGKPAQIWPVPVDVRSWQPGVFHISVAPVVAAKSGTYRLGLAIQEPASGRSSIRFANALPTPNGYTVLGVVKVVKGLTK